MSEEITAIFTEHDHGDDSPDVEHKTPYDRTGTSAWLLEDATKDGNVLTQDGIFQIVHHKYKGGEYTHLDESLNPMWTSLAELLPMSMAPNLVTTIGGAFCFLSYMATWYYLEQFEQGEGFDQVPTFLLIFNGLAVAIYYTLDCMDGKQARRTGTSSPLGQLFDHGVDCCSNMAHLSACQSFLLMGPSRGYLFSQVGLQVLFFATQWEEYYTGTLPHAYGKWLGVTEVNYGLSLIVIANAFIDTKNFYNQTMQQLLYTIIPISILPDNPKAPSIFVTILNSFLTCKLKNFICFVWICLAVWILLGCMARVARHIKSPGTALMACTKLLSPSIMAVMILGVLPLEAIQQECRCISLSAGLCYIFITIKIIVFCMARMAYATLQWDILPLVAVIGFVTYEYEYASYRRLKPPGLKFLFQVLTLYYLIRLLIWAHIVTQQLCEKLDVWMFTIKPKAKKKKE